MNITGLGLPDRERRRMGAIRFTVPVRPIGVNAAYAPARWGRRHGFRKTDAAVQYSTLLQLAARRAMRGRDPFSGHCEVRLLFVYPDNRSDVDGAVKLSLDALEGCVYWDDRQVVRLVAEKAKDAEAPRVEVEVVEV